MASRDEWQGTVGRRWALNLEPHERMMAETGLKAMDALGDLAGARALDLGCGGGMTTFALAGRVGPGGAAVGLDISPDLLARARERHWEEGEDPRLRFEEADAATWQADAPFNALYSRCGAMFFEDERAAYANLRAQMAPGGRMALMVWAEREACFWGGFAFQVLEGLLPKPDMPGADAPGPFRWGKIAPKLEMLAAAGWTDPQAARLEHETPLSQGDDPDPCMRAVEHLFHAGPAARPLAALDEAAQAEARARMLEAYRPYVKEDRVMLPAAVWIVTAAA